MHAQPHGHIHLVYNICMHVVIVLQHDYEIPDDALMRYFVDYLIFTSLMTATH